MFTAKRAWLVALIGICAAALTIGAGAGTSTTTSATCTPDASPPAVYSDRTGIGGGMVWCQSGAPGYCYTVKLVNRAGSALITNNGCYAGYSYSVTTSRVRCAGAWVHSFIYINVAGAGKSSTSGDKYC